MLTCQTQCIWLDKITEAGRVDRNKIPLEIQVLCSTRRISCYNLPSRAIPDSEGDTVTLISGRNSLVVSCSPYVHIYVCRGPIKLLTSLVHRGEI